MSTEINQSTVSSRFAATWHVAEADLNELLNKARGDVGRLSDEEQEALAVYRKIQRRLIQYVFPEGLGR